MWPGVFLKTRLPDIEILMNNTSHYSWPFFELSHASLARELDEWCCVHLKDEDHSLPVNDRCSNILEKLASGGWLRYVVGKEYGGIHENLDVRSLCIIRETLARYSGLADFVFAMQGLGSGVINLFGSPEQKRNYLPGVVTGSKTAAFALTELASGSDVASLSTSAKKTDHGYEINGQKTLISNAGLADFYVLFARSLEIEGSRGISAFIVDSTLQGIDDSHEITVNVPHPMGNIVLNECVVPNSSLVGEEGAGFKIAMATLDVFRSTVGAAALGFARHALHEASDRAVGRTLFGMTLAENPVTQSKIAEMVVDVDASALLVYRAAWQLDCGSGRTTREAAIAKLYATERAQSVIDKAVQIFGGAGVVVGVPVELLYREIRALRIYEGASEVQKLIIAKNHLASYAD